MPGTPKCAWCGSLDTQAGFDLVQCLACGHHTTMTGEKAVSSSLANEGVTVKSLEADLAVPKSKKGPAPADAAPAEQAEV